MAYGTEGLCIQKDLGREGKRTLMASPEFATWDYPPQVLCSQEGPDLKPDEINGRNPSGTKRLWIRNYSLFPVRI